MGWLTKPLPPVEGIDADTRAWLTEKVDLVGELGFSTGETHPRWEAMQCPYCQGIHFRACPRVKSLRYHENGQLARVDFWPDGTYDDSDVIWPDMLFAEGD